MKDVRLEQRYHDLTTVAALLSHVSVSKRMARRRHCVSRAPDPARSMQSMRGFLKGIDTTIEREPDRL